MEKTLCILIFISVLTMFGCNSDRRKDDDMADTTIMDTTFSDTLVGPSDTTIKDNNRAIDTSGVGPSPLPKP